MDTDTDIQEVESQSENCESTTVANEQDSEKKRTSFQSLSRTISSLLSLWHEAENEFARESQMYLQDLDQFHETLRNEDLHLREERVQLAEERTKLAYDHAEQEAEKLDQQQSLQQMVNKLERERAELDIELENVRQHAEVLADQLAEQKRMLTTERESWTLELRQLRQTLEKQSQTLSQRVEASAALLAARNANTTQPAPTTAAGRARATDGADAVVDAVKAQFEMLQKDFAKRRTVSKA
jgi:chromosome segregation ATPase